MTTPPHKLVLPRDVVNQILMQAQKDPETETCGLLGALDGEAERYYPVKNIAADPVARFEMDPQQQIDVMRTMRDKNEELLAIVHSHPHSPPVPSAADLDEYGYPDVFYLIVSLDVKGVLEIRGYRQSNETMQRIDLRYGQADED